MSSFCPRCDMSLDPMVISTPETARHLLTSVAQVVYPALYLSISRPGFTASICCLFNFLKCFTVSSKTSAFSNLLMLSPSDCKANIIRSLSSSRQLLILALRFLSINGLTIFLYSSVLDIGSSIGSDFITGAMVIVV